MINLITSSANYNPASQEQTREPNALTAVAKRVFEESPPPAPQMRASSPRLSPPPFSLDALPELDLAALASPTSTKKSRPESRPNVSPEPTCEPTH